jgi:hypothetical protein
VSVGFVPERYMFTVEPSGSLPPVQILESALTTLIGKMRDVAEHCTRLTAAAAGAMGGGAAAAGGGAPVGP